MVDKVTDPLKIVTDPVLLSTLVKSGIDPDYVEFYQDYAMPAIVDGKKEKGKSPYAKFYHDLKSNKKFAVFSGLPKVDADGVKIDVGWKLAGINYFAEKNNLFKCKVQGTQVEVTVKNDQSDGRKAGDTLLFSPQLFLDGVEKTCGAPTLLPTDPINSDYSQNVLEWDYGICKRRLRIIEGKLLGSWVFTKKPIGTIGIKYNQTGDYRLRLGQFKINDDGEQVSPKQFDELVKIGNYPVIISDSTTFYPVPDTTEDGVAYHILDNQTWATIRDGAGTGANDTATSSQGAGVSAGTNASTWYLIVRGLYVFDVSALAGETVIAPTTFSLYGHGGTDPGNWDIEMNIYQSAPANNNAIVAGDYDSLSTTPFCDTPIAIDSWAGSYNAFAFNAAGIAFIQAAIDGAGIAKLGSRESKYDVANSPPAYVKNEYSYFTNYFAEQGTTYRPKLVVTYSTSIDYPISASCSLGFGNNVYRGFAKIASAPLGTGLTVSKALAYSRIVSDSTVLTLRPNAAGDETSINLKIPGTGEANWEDVDETPPDDGSTFVYTKSTTYIRDLYNLPNHTIERGVINSITIYIRIAAYGENTIYAKPSQKNGTTVTDGTEVSQVGYTWTTFSQTWAENPDTSAAYTWDDIDALQIGAQIKSADGGYNAYFGNIWVEVNYTPTYGGCPLGFTPTASRGFAKIASNTLGFTAISTKGIGKIVSVTLGFGLSVSRQLVLSRTSATTLGFGLTVSRLLKAIRTASTPIGFGLTVSRVLSLARSATNTLGFGLNVYRGFVKTASTSIGFFVKPCVLYIKQKRTNYFVGTNRSNAETGTNRTIATTGTNKTTAETGTNRTVDTTGTNRNLEDW